MSCVPNTKKDQEQLLSALGKKRLADLFDHNHCVTNFELPKPLSEPELLEELAAASQKNSAPNNFLGAGCYNHFIPSVVRHIISRSEFYTAYTPYQAEISQGILQVIFEYQSMICELTGMDVTNASMYDGATAMAEAALLACRVTSRKKIIVSAAVHPEYRQVLQTYCRAADLELKTLPYDPKTGQTNFDNLEEGAACVILAQPNFFGCLEHAQTFGEKAHERGALFIVSVDPISLGLLKAPGDYGADIVVGEGQSLGNPQSFGGPALGIFALKQNLARQIPGRVVGQTVDAKGKKAYCLTLQTREQHIRRERATSNICSNEALAALAAAVYLSVMGKQGLKKVAELCLQKANYFKKKFGSKAFFSAPTFKEFVAKTDKKIGLELEPFYPELKGSRLICVTELTKSSLLP
ncbi:MAG: aminomethyl-transferring glycine dehydrogenase subunit GcvPA [bacterium]